MQPGIYRKEQPSLSKAPGRHPWKKLTLLPRMFAHLHFSISSPGLQGCYEEMKSLPQSLAECHRGLMRVIKSRIKWYRRVLLYNSITQDWHHNLNYKSAQLRHYGRTQSAALFLLSINNFPIITSNLYYHDLNYLRIPGRSFLQA